MANDEDIDPAVGPERERLYQHLQDEIAGLAPRLACRHRLSTDEVQDVADKLLLRELRIGSRLPQCLSGSRALLWTVLDRGCRNKVAQLARRRQHEGRVADDMDPDTMIDPRTAVVDGLYSVERVIEGKEEQARFARALESLPIESHCARMVIALKLLDWSDIKIQRWLQEGRGITTSAAKKRVKRAFDVLTLALEDGDPRRVWPEEYDGRICRACRAAHCEARERNLGRPRHRPPTERQEAEQWMVSQLMDGPRSTKDLFPAATEAGIKIRNLQRAAEHLEVVRELCGVGQPSVWMLPVASRRA